MDATTATAAAADILSPKTAMLADGVMTTGTGSGGGGGIDLSDIAVSISQNSIGGLFTAFEDGSWDSLELTVTSGTNPILIDFGRPIKGFVAYPKSITLISGLAENEYTAFNLSIFDDPDGNGEQIQNYNVNRIKTNGASQNNLFNRVSAYSLVNGVLSLTPTFPGNALYHPFGFGYTYIFVYWWEE